jgi:hypothetical protein
MLTFSSQTSSFPLNNAAYCHAMNAISDGGPTLSGLIQLNAADEPICFDAGLYSYDARSPPCDCRATP